MGKEADVDAVLEDGPDRGRLQYEPPKLIFRGRARRVFDGEALKSVRAEGEALVVGEARFRLGERAAASWAAAILNPKGRMEKIGVKPGMRAGVMGVADATLDADLAAAGAQVTDDMRDLDLLFYAADTAEELARVAALVPALKPSGALWIVSRKGKAATLKDVEVMAAAKAQGLVDNKVVSFSDTHTALRFVRRRTPVQASS